MAARLLAVLVAGAAAVFVLVEPAFASLGDEVAAGQAVAAQLQRGKTSCDGLSSAEFEHVGEYVMDRMIGSRASHEAMNQRMTQAIGVGNTDRMHKLMGGRFAGCGGGASAGGSMGSGAWGMMGGSGWAWMHDGSWQHMSQSQWRDVASRMMGSRYTAGHHSWSTGAVVTVALGAVLLGALLAVLLVRRPGHRGPPATARPA